MNSKGLDYLPLIKSLSFTLKQYRLYSERHPITKETLKKLDDEIEHYFSFKEKMTVGAMRHRLLVDGAVIDDKEVAAHDLAKEMERMGVEGLILERGVDVGQISSLISLMAMRAKMLEEKGGFKKAFEGLNLSHIRLSQGKFQLVEEGEVVTDAALAGEAGEPAQAASGEEVRGAAQTASAAGKAPPITDIVEIIQKIREGSPEVVPAAGPVAMDPEKIIHQIEKNPKDFVEAALKDVEDEIRLEHVIRQTVKLLIEGLLSFLVEQGKDITRALEKLAKELEKGLQGIGEGEGYERLREKIPVIFEEATDELRIRMMRKSYQNKPDDMKNLEKTARKIFKDKEVRERLKPDLMEEMEQAGLSPAALEEIFVRMDTQAEKKMKKVSVDAEELEELRKKAALYDSGDDGGGGMEKKLQILEIENKIIRHQKQRMDAVVRNLAEGLLVVDEQGKVVLMNPAAERLLGVKQSDKAGRPVAEGLGKEHVVAMETKDLRDRDGPGNFSQHVQLMGPNEETKRILRTSTAVIENEDGQTVGMVSVLSDVTRQKELEELKNKFVANVSHELRTPLVAIQKSLSVILEKEVGEVSPEQEKFLSIAYRNIDRLSRLINDLLDISRLEAGQMNLKPTNFPVTGLIQHVISTVETWSRDKNISLLTEFAGGNFEIEADADRVTQVITNLVGNAIKFTPDGGSITIEAKSGVTDPAVGDGPCIEVAVRDTGIGISPEDQQKIFDKFVQVGLVQPSGVSSSGLGLSITKEIVELHSGRIWVESDGKTGSRFAFRIPVRFKINQRARG